MPSPKPVPELERLTQTQRERLAYIEVKAFYCGDLTRADIECRFGVKPAASARDLVAYRRFAPNNLVYDAGLRCYRATNTFRPLFEQIADRILTWFRSGMGDGLDIKVRRSVPCESASDLVFPDLEILAIITRAISSKQLIQVRYLSLTSGPSTKTLAPLALANTGLRWHLRAHDCEKKRFADFVLTRIAKAQPLNEDIPVDQQIEADVQWARVVHLELVPHPGVVHRAAIEADYGMTEGMLTLNMRAPLVGYALRRWAVDCSEDLSLDHNSHHLCLKNRATLYGVESAALAPGYVPEKGAVNGPL
jgi:hypothetical protein